MKVVLKDFFIENDETYYVITIENKMLEWNVRKRFSQFIYLYGELHRLYPEFEIPKLDKQIIGFKQDKRNEDLRRFLGFVVGNFTLSGSNPFLKFLYTDIFVDTLNDFLSITKHKQKEYVKNFLAEPKINNYKNYITTLENQIMEIIEHKKSILAQLNTYSARVNQLEPENNSFRLQMCSLNAENSEYKRIYENNKKTIQDLNESISSVQQELENYLNQIRDLEYLNKQFRQKMEKAEEELRRSNQIIRELERQKIEQHNEISSLKMFMPSAPPMPDNEQNFYYSSGGSSYRESLSRPPSLK